MNDPNSRPGAHHVSVPADRDGQRLDNFLMHHLGQVPRSLVYRLVRTGQVRVNGRRAKPMKKLCAGDDVRIPPVTKKPPESAEVPAARVAEIETRIIHRDEHYFIVDKPAGLAVQGGSGLAFGLIDVLARIDESCRPVHRLDRPTSGLVAVARGYPAARALQRAFAGREVEKGYLALLSGRLPEDAVTVDAPLKKVRDSSGQHRVVVAPDGLPARTHFKVLERLGEYSYVEARIETGRTHQIRAHAAHSGHPIAGDDRYNPQSSLPQLDRLFLHAHYLKLPWPEERIFSSPLPQALAATIDRLRGAAPNDKEQ